MANPQPVPGKESPKHEVEFPPDLVPSKSWAEALRGMADRPFLASAKWKQQQERADREGMHPDLREHERLLVKRMAGLGVPMFASEVLRSEARQDQLYADGFSQALGGQGAHPRGCAYDLIHSGKGWGLTDEQWLIVGHIGKELAKAKGIKLRWGGDFEPRKASGLGWDPAHWEIADYKSVMDQYPFPKLGFPWVANWRNVLKRAADQVSKL